MKLFFQEPTSPGSAVLIPISYPRNLKDAQIPKVSSYSCQYKMSLIYNSGWTQAKILLPVLRGQNVLQRNTRIQSKTRKYGAQIVNVAEICVLFGECDKGTMAGWWQGLPSNLFCETVRQENALWLLCFLSGAQAQQVSYRVKRIS